jgi:hypothetical protein
LVKDFDSLAAVVRSKAFQEALPGLAEISQDGTRITVREFEKINAALSDPAFSIRRFDGRGAGTDFTRRFFEFESARHQDKANQPDLKYFYDRAQMIEALAQKNFLVAESGAAMLHELESHFLGWTQVTREQLGTWSEYAREVIRIAEKVPEEKRKNFYLTWIESVAEGVDLYTDRLNWQKLGVKVSDGVIEDPIPRVLLESLRAYERTLPGLGPERRIVDAEGKPVMFTAENLPLRAGVEFKVGYQRGKILEVQDREHITVELYRDGRAERQVIREADLAGAKLPGEYVAIADRTIKIGDILREEAPAGTPGVKIGEQIAAWAEEARKLERAARVEFERTIKALLVARQAEDEEDLADLMQILEVA